MVIKTGDEYRDSLRKRKPMNIYFMGKKVEDPLSHPIINAAVNSIAMTYDLANQSDYKELMTTKSALTGNQINRFCHIHQSVEDLLNKVKMQRLLGQKTGTCFQRCVGMDAMNAVFITTYEIDEKYGTNYHQKFRNYIKMAEENDWTIDGCMTDPKGDRSKRPSELKDPDLYLRIVERRDDGVVIRGAKAHQTGAINSHEHLIMPTLTMRKEDVDYTICCAVPADDPNVIYIYGRQASDLRRLDDSEYGNIDCGNAEFGGQEALVIFEDVFVPNERIFMNGETDVYRK